MCIMWENIAIVLLFLSFFIVLFINKRKEGFENPYTTTQQQQGDIQDLHNKLNNIKISEESIKIIENNVSVILDQTLTLQKNIETNKIMKLAPN